MGGLNRGRRFRNAAALVGALVLCGCAGLGPPEMAPEHVYVLEAQVDPVAQAKVIPLTLVVSLPRAAPGFDTSRMAFVRQPYALEYFSRNRWADAPAKMIGPLLVRALEQRSGFNAVAPAAGLVKGDVRLDTELLLLQQEFTTSPSRLHLSLRVQLVELANRRVLATQIFEATENASSDDPYGGVVAANRALQRLLAQIADFAASAREPQKSRD
ncbi:MAG: ABC-type transport auxiliary lipoprotein family protein [Sulfuricella sp.]|nr:ABC-type transport auxiliary lipoprotein family protein [Sulfuricella sp.]